MNTTKMLLSELVYDFQSKRWNEFELPKLSLRELHALAKLLGCPSHGNIETLIVRLLAQRKLRFKLARFMCREPVFRGPVTNALSRQVS
jgi:hypothetical protein